MTAADRRHMRRLPLSAMALALGLGVLHQPLTAQQPTDSAAVIEVVERYHAALESGDSATAMSLLAPGAIILESGGMETREEYCSHHLPADMRFAAAVEREQGPVHVTVYGGTAWVASTSRSRGTFRDREIDSRGAELMVLRLTSGGWKIEAIHWSSRN